MIIGKKVLSAIAGTSILGGGIGVYSYLKSSQQEPYKMPKRLVEFDKKEFWGEKKVDSNSKDKDKFIYF